MSARNQGGCERSKIIGGMFGLELGGDFFRPEGAVLPPLLIRPHLRLATARSGFALLAETLKPGSVWLPSYLCSVIPQSVASRNFQVRYYAVDEHLGIAGHDWLREIRRGDMVVFIDYFGFRTWEASGEQARQHGAWVIEDTAQAMLNMSFSDQSHYIIASPRKFVGVPDGGILAVGTDVLLPEVELAASDSAWWLKALRASMLRAEFDRHGGDREWFEIFLETEAAGPSEPRRMSELSQLLLERLDWAEISRARRGNYQFLASELGRLALFPDLPPETVPLGFPIRVRDRDWLRQTLFDAQIYPPVHWQIGRVVPDDFKASHALAGEIMTIPCDQRYGREDLERVVNCLAKAQPA